MQISIGPAHISSNVNSSNVNFNLENNGQPISLSNSNVNINNGAQSPNMSPFANIQSSANLAAHAAVNAAIRLHHINANLNSSMYQQQQHQHFNSMTHLNNLMSQHQQQHQQQQQIQSGQPIIHIPSIISYPLNGREQNMFNPRVRIPRIQFLDRSLEVIEFSYTMFDIVMIFECILYYSGRKSQKIKTKYYCCKQHSEKGSFSIIQKV